MIVLIVFLRVLSCEGADDCDDSDDSGGNVEGDDGIFLALDEYEFGESARVTFTLVFMRVNKQHVETRVKNVVIRRYKLGRRFRL